MKSKPLQPDELRMNAAEFDKVMRRALSALPPKATAALKPRPKKKKAAKK